MIEGILIGIICGYIASKLQKGEGSGCWVNLFLGIVGGVVGGWLFGLLGLDMNGTIGSIITGTVGAVIVLWIFAKLKK